MESVPEVISEILECYGCLDVLIFNSSMKVKAPVQCLSLEMDRIVMDVNYFGPITLVKGKTPEFFNHDNSLNSFSMFMDMTMLMYFCFGGLDLLYCSCRASIAMSNR